MNIEMFVKSLAEKGISLNDKQLKQFDNYYQLLVKWNKNINLTAITVKEEVYLKHFYDSLMPLWLTDGLFEGNLTLCDVGAGAGFPSIPMKIVQTDLKLTIIDSLNKRITFIDELVALLELDHVRTIHGRAEDIGQNPDYRQKFDRVTARAVAQLNVLSELCLPLVQKDGYFIALKGQKANDELEEAQQAISLLGAKYEYHRREPLPLENSDREIIVIRKTLDTPKKYPRKPGKPAKQPLK